MKRLVAAAFAALSLSACVSEMPATGEEAAKLSQACTNYGFRTGTDAHAACLLQLDQNRISENRRRRIAFGEALSDAGNQMQANARANQISAAYNRPVNCTSRRGYGGTVQTSCY
jgi:hypothetical protein